MVRWWQCPECLWFFLVPVLQGESMTRFSVPPKLKLIRQVGVACSVPEHEVEALKSD